MGRIFVVEFDQPNPDYYMCKLCRTHIALRAEFECIHLHTTMCGGVFHKAVNVQVDKPDHHYQIAPHTVANIYCVKCGDMLGWKYVDGEEDINIRLGDVKLIMQKLLWRCGDQIRDAPTGEDL